MQFQLSPVVRNPSQPQPSRPDQEKSLETTGSSTIRTKALGAKFKKASYSGWLLGTVRVP